MPIFMSRSNGVPFFFQVLAGFAEHHLGVLQLEHRAHEREHDADVAGRAGPQDRPQLRAEHIRVLEREADAAQAEEGVGLVFGKRNAGQLVGAEVDRPHDDRLVAHRGGDGRVRGRLLFFGRLIVAREEEELGAIEADAVGPALLALLDFVGELDVAQQLDAHARRPFRPAGRGAFRAWPRASDIERPRADSGRSFLHRDAG